MTNHYELLGVPVTATEDEITRAYKQRALRCHPDRTVRLPEAEREALRVEFDALASAYAVLTDTAKRGAYDGRFAFNLKARAAAVLNPTKATLPPREEPPLPAKRGNDDDDDEDDEDDEEYAPVRVSPAPAPVQPTRPASNEQDAHGGSQQGEAAAAVGPPAFVRVVLRRGTLGAPWGLVFDRSGALTVVRGSGPAAPVPSGARVVGVNDAPVSTLQEFVAVASTQVSIALTLIPTH